MNVWGFVFKGNMLLKITGWFVYLNKVCPVEGGYNVSLSRQFLLLPPAPCPGLVIFWHSPFLSIPVFRMMKSTVFTRLFCH